MYRPSPWDDDYEPHTAASAAARAGYNRQAWDADSDPGSDEGGNPNDGCLPNLVDESDDDEADRKPVSDFLWRKWWTY